MNCIVVDDEPIARTGMLSLIKKLTTLEVKGAFKNASEAGAYLEKNRVDLIFLDIQMPIINGIKFAKSILKKSQVIFTTAHPQYALESYEIDAVDYLLKPIREERFLKAVNKAIEYSCLLSDAFEKSTPDIIEENSITVRGDRRIYKILHRDILYIEGMKDYSIVFTKTNKVITAMNLKTIHGHLPESLFKRVSKSYIINKSQVTSVSTTTIFVNETQLPLGKSYRKAFIKHFTENS